MQREERMSAEQYLLKKRRKSIWQRIVIALACVVVFCTTYALILPAITQERDVFCGLEAHTHTEDCYTQLPEAEVIQQICAPEVHTHSDSCLDEEGVLICGQLDYIAHIHNELCVDADGNLHCTLEERETHVHTDACWQTVETVVPAEIHSHTEACSTVQRGELICELPESEEHSHVDACYEQLQTLTCGLEEGAVISEESVQTETVLVCTEVVAQDHVHEEACFQTVIPEAGLTCELEENDAHTHSKLCYGTWILSCEMAEHVHSLACYADMTADVETAEDWEKTFENVELTGVWAEDVLALAQSQLGYQESTKNYVVMEDGVSTKGYTRYGAWYGDPYGDWCAMFTSFCLHYAGVEDMPLDSNCPNWIEKLTEAGLYQPQGTYVPVNGNLIFFDWDANGNPDHVGFVTQVIADEETGMLQISTVEGNNGNRVLNKTYSMDDETILGYGSLPVQLTEEEQVQVDSVIAMIDAMPSADEIDAKIEEFEAAEDYEGEEAWLTETYQQVAAVYHYYSRLNDFLKSKVTNADKLLELEYIWSVTPYVDEIASDAPTAIESASTKDFIELNLYDYNSKINTNYNSNNAWPGFQWNGGAYVPGVNKNTSAKSYDRHAIDFIDFGNSIITDNTYGGNAYSFSGNSISKNRWNIGNQGGNINAIVQYPTGDYANKPVGISNGTEVLGRNLTTAGYPWVTNAGSMVDYFSNSSFSTKQNTESIDGLFQINDTTGGYFYNSRWNHAQYDNNKFTLYEEIITPNFITYPFGNFLPLNDITNGSTATQVSRIKSAGSGYVQHVINDLWYNSSLRNQSTGAWYDATAEQLVDMLAKYRVDLQSVTTTGGTAWTTWSAKDAIYDYIGNGPTDDTGPITDALLEKMYNIDWDVATNFFFGMEMKMKFMQPKDGLTGKDNGDNVNGTWFVNANGDDELSGESDGISDYPMHFYFTGDDDVWVYIDDVLFLDLSGIHRHVGGEIDFVNGKVHYYALEPATGDVSKTPYATYTFAQLLAAAGKSTSGLNSNGTFIDYTTHEFKFFYMERGSGSSVCRLNFNFPLLRKNTISVSKENVTTTGVAADEIVVGNPDYYFNLMSASGNLFVGPNSVTGISQYKVEDSDGNILKNADGTDKIFTTDEYGIFTLKAGQTAYFEGIKENSGTYYVQELIKAEDNKLYPEVYVNEVISQFNQIITWTGRTYFSQTSEFDSENPTIGPYGAQWYGRSGQFTDAGTNAAYHFEQQNRLDVAKLGKLQITKELIEEVPSRAITYYKMHVILDGEPLPIGTNYEVNGSNRTVQEPGCIELAAGEAATISNIISGTKFEVYEDAASAAGYTVTYEATGASDTQNSGSSITGVIHIGDSETAPLVSVKVTNADSGTQVQIPVTKSFVKLDGLNREFTFTLEQVDQNGNAVDGGTNLSTTIATPTESAGQFDLTYLARDFGIGQTTLYYKITESAAAGSLQNTQVFIAEVTVTKTAGSGTMTAVSKIHPEGSTAEVDAANFVNTLTGELTLEKIVAGSTEAQTNEEFTFVIRLLPGESGIDSLPNSFAATFYQQDGTVEPTTVGRSDDGVITLSGFKHGEKAVIHGIPIGTQWAIKENAADGFSVTTKVTVNGAEPTTGIGAAVGGGITAGSTDVVYTNTQMYELPETGGAGVTLYTMAGLMLMLCSMAFLLYRYQKRRKEVQ